MAHSATCQTRRFQGVAKVVYLLSELACRTMAEKWKNLAAVRCLSEQSEMLKPCLESGVPLSTKCECMIQVASYEKGYAQVHLLLIHLKLRGNFAISANGNNNFNIMLSNGIDSFKGMRRTKFKTCRV